MAITFDNILNNINNQSSIILIPVTEVTGTTSKVYNGANLELHKSYEDAVYACNLIHLNPGAVHTEFYYIVENNKKIYHCVIAIGNWKNSGLKHLLLTDFGDNSFPFYKLINLINSSLGTYEKSIKNLCANLTEFNTILDSHSLSIDGILNQLNGLNGNVSTLINDQAGVKTLFNTLKNYVETSIEEIPNLSNLISNINSSLSNIIEKNTLNILENTEEIENIIKNISNLSINTNNRIQDINNTLNILNHVTAENRQMIKDVSNKLKLDIKSVNANILNVSTSINNKIDQELPSLKSELQNNIDTKVKLVSTYMSSKINDGIQLVTNQFNEKINRELNNIDSSIIYNVNILNNKIDHVKASSDTNINSKILDLSTKIDELIESNNAAHIELSNKIDVKYNLLDNKIDHLSVSLTNLIDNKYIDVSNKIDNMVNHIKKDIKDLSTYVDNRFIISEASTKLYIDSNIDDINNNLTILNNKVNISNTSIYNITKDLSAFKKNTNAGINIINSSIYQLNELMYKNIIDPSIISLFDKDIYTVNLCCWTPAGHIEISDEYPTNGQYRTYIIGDDVSLKAVEHKGYKFSYWLKNDTRRKIDTSIINLTFIGDDINVIGTTADDENAYVDVDRYTAIFTEMHKINHNIEILNLEVSELSGDILLISGLSDDPYFEDHSNIIIKAIPIDERHEFKYMVVDGSTVTSTDYSIINAIEDHSVTAYFKEIRYKVVGEPNVPQWGDVKSNKGTEVLMNTSVTLTAEPFLGYEFVNWVFTYDPSTVISTHESITVRPTKSTGDILVVANFKHIE